MSNNNDKNSTSDEVTNVMEFYSHVPLSCKRVHSSVQFRKLLILKASYEL